MPSTIKRSFPLLFLLYELTSLPSSSSYSWNVLRTPENEYEDKITLNLKNVSSEEDSNIRLNFLLEFPTQKCPPERELFLPFSLSLLLSHIVYSFIYWQFFPEPCNKDSVTFLATLTSPNDPSRPTKNFTLKINTDENHMDLYDFAPLCAIPDALEPGFFVEPASMQVSAGQILWR